MTNEQLLRLIAQSKRAIGMTPQDEMDFLNQINSGTNFSVQPGGDELLDLLKNVDSSTPANIPAPPTAGANILSQANPMNSIDEVLAKAPAAITRNAEAVNVNKISQLKGGLPNVFGDSPINILNNPSGVNPVTSAPGGQFPLALVDDVANAAATAAPSTGKFPLALVNSPAAGAAKASGAAGKMGGLFGKLKGAAGKAGGVLGKGLNALNKAAPVIGGVTQGIDSAFALGDLANTSGDVGELERLILAEAAGAKNYSGMSVDDERMIQGMRRGIKPYNKGKLGEFLKGAGKGLGGAAITGGLGLIPGMQFLLPIAAAQLATSGVKGITQSKETDIADLQGLYQRLQQNKGRIA
jgi:hypothetical protein